MRFYHFRIRHLFFTHAVRVFVLTVLLILWLRWVLLFILFPIWFTYDLHLLFELVLSYWFNSLQNIINLLKFYILPAWTSWVFFNLFLFLFIFNIFCITCTLFFDFLLNHKFMINANFLISVILFFLQRYPVA